MPFGSALRGAMGGMFGGNVGGQTNNRPTVDTRPSFQGNKFGAAMGATNALANKMGGRNAPPQAPMSMFGPKPGAPPMGTPDDTMRTGGTASGMNPMQQIGTPMGMPQMPPMGGVDTGPSTSMGMPPQMPPPQMGGFRGMFGPQQGQGIQAPMGGYRDPRFRF